MTSLRALPSRRLRGSFQLPADKSIGHRYLMTAALTDGPCVFRGFSGAQDHLATFHILRSLGVDAQLEGDRVEISGVGLRGLRAPEAPLDCGNSGTTMRLMSGLLAAQSFDCELFGDVSLNRRPMGRVTQPLNVRGARISGVESSGKLTAPLKIQAARDALQGGNWSLKVASAQIKSALLYSGLYAADATCVEEPAPSRDHTERLFEGLGVRLERPDPKTCRLLPWEAPALPAFSAPLPTDPSSAAFPIVAALLCPDSELYFDEVCLNPRRIGAFKVLERMGAQLSYEASETASLGEVVGTVRVRTSALRGTTVGGEEVPALIDEVPILAVAAAFADSPTHFAEVGELRHKESDRIASTTALLEAAGAEVEVGEDWMRVHPLRAVARQASGDAVAVDCGHDHRIGMSGLVLGLASARPVKMLGTDCIETSFPRFAALMRQLGAQIEAA